MKAFWADSKVNNRIAQSLKSGSFGMSRGMSIRREWNDEVLRGVLGLLLFLMYIENITDGLKNSCADDTRLPRTTNCKTIQRNLDSVC